MEDGGILVAGVVATRAERLLLLEVGHALGVSLDHDKIDAGTNLVALGIIDIAIGIGTNVCFHLGSDHNIGDRAKKSQSLINISKEGLALKVSYV